MGWNGSAQGNATSTTSSSSKGARPAHPPSRGLVKGLLALLLIAAFAGALFYVLFGDKPAPKAKPAKKPAAIKEVQPAVVSRQAAKTELPVAVETNTVKEVAKPERRVVRPVGAKTPQVLTLADGTVITNKPRNIFKRDLEKTLYAALFPGSMTSGLFARLKSKYNDEQILAMLREMTVPEEGDDEVAVGAKKRVQAFKEDILLAVQNGATVSEVLDQIRRQRIDENILRAQTAKLRREALKTDDPEIVRETIEAANQLLEKKNLRKMDVPEQYKAPSEDDGADQPSESNDNTTEE